ncbi:MAG TPA: 50S ribosomal protein L21 [Phycisphaerae bacterium]|nr:50S ribosomal protein L21 [Phycisphaerae bacterium]
MYAIVEDGGKQYRVEKGDTIYIEKREVAPGETAVTFDRVLMVGNGADSRIGTPVLEGVTVAGKLVSALKGPKLDIVKFKRRKGYRLKKGHRQNHLKVTIEDING